MEILPYRSFLQLLALLFCRRATHVPCAFQPGEDNCLIARLGVGGPTAGGELGAEEKTFQGSFPPPGYLGT